MLHFVISYVSFFKACLSHWPPPEHLDEVNVDYVIFSLGKQTLLIDDVKSNNHGGEINSRLGHSKSTALKY